MKRFFNTAGPCVPGEHYLLDASERLLEVVDLIQRKQYFVIHAARQSGKTTLLLDLRKTLEAEGKHRALYCSLESLQGVTDPSVGIPGILDAIRAAVMAHPEIGSLANTVTAGDGEGFTLALRAALTRLCAALDKPLVLLLDEVDCLTEGTLITFLRQLRDGFVNRAGGSPFPSSVALVGMRNIRDYKAQVRPGGATLGSASPFNIASKSLTLANFTETEVGALYAQHTADTGQVFPPEAVARAFHWSQGQPWLVNALAHEVVDEILAMDYAKPVDAAMFDAAAERLILRRDTHIDSLVERLREERVRRIVEPVLLGDERDFDLLDDDCRYVLDLGILRADRRRLEPANPIYREVIVRTLNYSDQFVLRDRIPNRWVADGRLDMNGLLRGFQEFWRENADVWVEKYDYREAAPHLILMAFLQRVVNGGAHIDREFALGRKRLDLCVQMGPHRYPVELKLRYGTKTEAEG
ncbi:MAG: ATP-binding protein, partial [Lentisphaerae bacterium]|nr:ATP-binding protein [Lentisphaerota bacterium]